MTPVRTVFADTFHWVALIDDHDQWHDRAVALQESVEATTLLVTTDAVLVEPLDSFAEAGVFLRERAVSFVEVLLLRRDVQIIWQDREAFRSAFEFYRDRPDKGYSLTDCLSMRAMIDMEIYEVLTADHHFVQEGFQILAR